MCEYCALRDCTTIGGELLIEEWKEAFARLYEMGIDFNLILGNETWLLKDGLLDIMKGNKVPYALYTTCPEPLYSQYKDKYFDSGLIDNLSCGIDYPPIKLPIDDDSYRKSMDAWKGFTWIRNKHPNVDTQGTITVHRKNIHLVPELVHKLSELGVFVGINFIHWNKDGLYDFFPTFNEIKDLMFADKDYEMVKYYLGITLDDEEHLIQNPEFISQDVKMLTSMGWHCKGNPYGGPTIDADGHLRCCGYRRGIETPKLTIFDLPKRLDEWRGRVFTDAMNCPGCAWSYPWMYHYWEETNPSMGEKVFVKHAGDHIPKEKWSNRKIE